MHRKFLDKLGIDGSYETFSVPPFQLEEFITGGEFASLNGLNVTIPHKQSIAGFMHELTPDADIVSAVNSVAIRDGKFFGHNTDTLGFQKAIEMLQLDLNGKDVLLFGAGGAARAVVYVLGNLGVSNIYVRNRTAANAKRLSDILKNIKSKTELVVLEDFNKIPNSINIAINALGGGIIEAEWLDSLPELRFFYDLNYGQNALDKTLLKTDVGYSDGLSMLVYQGVESLKFWLDRDIPDDGLTESVLTELNGEI